MTQTLQRKPKFSLKHAKSVFLNVLLIASAGNTFQNNRLFLCVRRNGMECIRQQALFL